MILSDEKKYRCPECGSENLKVCVFAWVNANSPDDGEADVDEGSDVGDSAKWSCDDCENMDFLPKTVRKAKKS